MECGRLAGRCRSEGRRIYSECEPLRLGGRPAASQSCRCRKWRPQTRCSLQGERWLGLCTGGAPGQDLPQLPASLEQPGQPPAHQPPSPNACPGNLAMRLPEVGLAVVLTLSSELQSRPLRLRGALFSGKAAPLPRAPHAAPACAFSPWERVPVPLVLNTPFRHAFVESWLNSKLHNPQNVMALYDLKQMFASVPRSASPPW